MASGNMNVGNKPTLQRSTSLPNIDVNKKGDDEPKNKEVRSNSLKSSPKFENIVNKRQGNTIPPKRENHSADNPKLVSTQDNKDLKKTLFQSSTPPSLPKGQPESLDNLDDYNFPDDTLAPPSLPKGYPKGPDSLDGYDLPDDTLKPPSLPKGYPKNLDDLADYDLPDENQVDNRNNDNPIVNEGDNPQVNGNDNQVDNQPIVNQGNNQPNVNGNENLPPVNPNAILLVQQNLQNNPPPGHVQVNVPGLQAPVNLNLEMVPEGLRNAPDIQQQLQAKIQRGGEMFKNVSNGNIPDYMKPDYQQPLTNQQKKEKAKAISDMMFFIQARGEAKVGHFTQGAYSLPDPKGNVLKFLTSYEHAYNRSSSHINSIQKSDVSNDKLNPGTEHYGLDLHDDGTKLDTCLPNGKGTILFGKLPYDRLAAKQNENFGGDRLFLKIEDHGTGGGGVDDALDNPPGQATGKLQKIKDFFGHAKGYVKSLYRRITGNNNEEGTFKERVPPEMKKDFKDLIKATQYRESERILKKGKWDSSSGGLRVMMANIAELKRHNEFNGLPNDDPLRVKVAEFEATYGQDPNLDYQDMRIGQEVIFSDIDLKGVDNAPQQMANMPVPRQNMENQANRICNGFSRGIGENGQLQTNGADHNMVSHNRSIVSFPKVQSQEDPTILVDSPRYAETNNLNFQFARDFVRGDYTLIDGNTRIVGRECGVNGTMTEAGFDRVKNFFHGRHPNDPVTAEREMRIVTSTCNQAVTNFLLTGAFEGDPDSPMSLRDDMRVYPGTMRFADMQIEVRPNNDGTFSMHVDLKKKPLAQMDNIDAFTMGGSGNNIKLDPEKSDFHLTYELKIDPRNANLNSDQPRVTCTSFTGYEKFYDISGNLISKRP